MNDTGHAALRAALGHPVLEAGLLELALTHRSYAYEHGGLPTNERLEFLGDAVLGVIVTETLYRSYPDHSEGKLAKLRAAVVNARALAEVGRAIAVGPHIRLGKGEEATGGHDKDSILADTVEAVIGAVYLSGGFEAAEALVHHLVVPLVSRAITLGAGLDWKTSLQELCAELDLGVPQYILHDDGPDHRKTFTAQVKVGDRVFGLGTGTSKKQAEQQVAESTYRSLVVERDGSMPDDRATATATAATAAGILAGAVAEPGAEAGAESGSARDVADDADGSAPGA